MTPFIRNSRRSKPIYDDKIQNSGYFRGMVLIEEESERIFWGFENVLCLNLADSYTIIHINENFL